MILEFLGILAGQKAEIMFASKVFKTGEGREITRTKTEGSIKIVFYVSTSDTDKFGY